MTILSLERLAVRLARIGMPLDGERLRRAAQLLDLHGQTTDGVLDLTLATICVEAYRRADVEVAAVV